MSKQNRIKILLDVDTGVDDSLALLYALNKEEVEIVGITTVCGNVEARLAAENTLKILDLAGAPDIPVVCGFEKPLEGEWDGRTAFIHGDNGLGNVELPSGSRTLLEEDVCDFQIRLAQKYEHELVLVTLGPLTNIARTLAKAPSFAKKIKRCVMMGGTVYMRGNVSPVCEANFASDPAACDRVFQSGMEILAVGLDVTEKIRFTTGAMDWLDKCCSPHSRKAVDYMKQALAYYWEGNRNQNYCIGDCPLHDPLAMMAAVVPDLVRVEKRKARIECGGTYCRGMVVTDLREQPIPAEYVGFALDVDPKRALREFLSVFWKSQDSLPAKNMIE